VHPVAPVASGVFIGFAQRWAAGEEQGAFPGDQFN
jgi:hypothetical protein